MSETINKNHCRVLALESVLEFFDKTPVYLENINSIYNLIRNLEKNNLVCVATCPFFFIMSPFLWKIFLKNRVPLKNFLEIREQQTKSAIIHYLSAEQLYGLKDFWTHYVCEFFGEQYEYYDPYLSQLTHDYPTTVNYRIPVSKELLEYNSIKLLIFE